MNPKHTTGSMPLLSWDIFLESYQQLMSSSKLVRKDLAAIQKIANQFKWNREFEYQPWLISPLNAVIITDTRQHIVWVSHNFEEMTGYPPKEVMGKNPALLQGQDSSAQVKTHIRQHLEQPAAVKNAQLVNYRKNGEAYLCEFDIYPVFNVNEQLVHFIAFERELVA